MIFLEINASFIKLCFELSYIRVLRSLEDLEKSSNFCLVREFSTPSFFAPSLSLHMPSNSLGPSKTAGKSVKRSGNFEKHSLEAWKSQGIFMKS